MNGRHISKTRFNIMEHICVIQGYTVIYDRSHDSRADYRVNILPNIENPRVD